MHRTLYTKLPHSFTLLLLYSLSHHYRPTFAALLYVESPISYIFMHSVRTVSSRPLWGLSLTQQDLASTGVCPLIGNKLSELHDLLVQSSKGHVILHDLHVHADTKSFHSLFFCAVTKFNSPENFLSLLDSQVYGPTTQIIASDVSSVIALTHVPCLICSGLLPIQSLSPSFIPFFPHALTYSFMNSRIGKHSLTCTNSTPPGVLKAGLGP